MEYKEYAYSGPVMMFDRCVLNNWAATTIAVSEKKALSNLVYRYKDENNLSVKTKITLPGNLKLTR